MKNTAILVGFLIFSLLTTIQAQSVSIATWRNNADGVYSATFDDLGFAAYATSIMTRADTVYQNRGFKMSASVVTNPDIFPDMVNILKEHIADGGMSIVNHSFTHEYENNWWTDPSTFALEIDTAHAWIERYLEVSPKYFVFPGNEYSDDAINYLIAKGYIGCRGGGEGENNANFNPYTINWWSWMRAGGDVEWAMRRINQAIANGTWANIMHHSVEITPQLSYSIMLDTLRAIMDSCKVKSDAGELWVAPVTEIVQYKVLREEVEASIAYTADSSTVSFNTGTLDSASYAYPLTLIIELTSAYTRPGAVQNGTELQTTDIGSNTVQVDASPFDGDVIVYPDYTPSIKDRIVLKPVFSPLIQCPNPIYRGTVISVPFSGKTTLSIYNLEGRLVRQLQTGQNRYIWDGMNTNRQIMPSGRYVLRAETGSGNASGKRVLFVK